MENLLYKMYDMPALVEAVLTHIVDYYFAVSQRIFEEAADLIDVFFIGNDFGSQTGPLISDRLFRRFLLPHLERLIDLGHAYGLKVLLHCCGGFEPLIPAMIEAGLDGLQGLQPNCRGMDPASLKARYGADLLLMGSINSQQLIEGTPDSVRAETRRILEIMKPGGGYVACPSHDYVLYETPVEKLERIPGLLRDAITSAPLTRFDRAHFKKYGDFSLDFEIVYFVLNPDYNVYMDIQQKINLAILRRFQAEGIAFAYPTREVIIRKEPD